MIRQALSLSLVLVMLPAWGCNAVRVDVQRNPTAPPTAAHMRAVEVFEQGAVPSRSVLPIATLTAIGRSQPIGYASLKAALQSEAQTQGADAIAIVQSGTATGPTVHSFSGGIGISETLRYPTMSAVAYIWAPARVAFMVDDQNRVIDVPPGPAMEAGVRIGDRVLAINGARITNNRSAFWEAVSKLRPGDTVQIELVDSQNQTRTVSCTATDNR